MREVTLFPAVTGSVRFSCQFSERNRRATKAEGQSFRTQDSSVIGVGDNGALDNRYSDKPLQQGFW
jgi:hypothetical protein